MYQALSDLVSIHQIFLEFVLEVSEIVPHCAVNTPWADVHARARSPPGASDPSYS